MPLMKIGAPENFVYGLAEPGVEIVLPHGQVKVRFRKGDWARAFVRNKHGIAEYYIVKTKDGCYGLGPKAQSTFRASFSGVGITKSGPKIQVLKRIVRYRPRKLLLSHNVHEGNKGSP